MTAANAASAIGTVIYTHPVTLDSFTASFQFRIGEGGGGRYDGMGFMIETTGPNAVGGPNSLLGMGNLGGYGVEFDLYNNGQCGDSSSDHIGIDQLETCGSTMPTSLFVKDMTGTLDIADTSWHETTVQLAGSAMSVTVDGNAVASSVQLTGFTPGAPDAGTAYFGFSGATGGNAPNGGMQMEVKDVTITFQTPRCL